MRLDHADMLAAATSWGVSAHARRADPRKRCILRFPCRAHDAVARACFGAAGDERVRLFAGGPAREPRAGSAGAHPPEVIRAPRDRAAGLNGKLASVMAGGVPVEAVQAFVRGCPAPPAFRRHDLSAEDRWQLER
jgi:hypothetical protein